MILALATTLLAITVTVPKEAKVRGQDVTLGEVARIEGATPEVQARIEAVALGYTPTPGFSRVLTRADIAEKLRTTLAGTAVDVVGADRCRIEIETEIVQGEQLRGEASKALRLGLTGRDVTIADDGATADVVVPKSESRVELRATLDLSTLRTGVLSVPVQIWIDGAPYQTVPTSFRVDLYEQMPVLVTDVRRGEQLSSSYVAMRRTRIDGGVPGDPLSMASVPGATALRDMQRGAVLTTRDVQRAQLVKRGDVVQIQVRKGPVVARATAIATADGCLGDKVRVTTTDSKRELAAVVIGRGSVEVDLTATP